VSQKKSYLLTGDKVAERKWPQVKSEPLSLTGLWLTAKAFNKYGKKGEIRMVIDRSELEEFDIVAVNLTGGNLPLPQVLREELGTDSDTKLVVNIDFQVDNWDSIWTYPILVAKALEAADLVFHVEPVGAAFLEHALKRRVYVLPHPVDLEGLDRIKKTERDPTIVTVYHRHSGGITTPYFAQKGLPLYRILLGYIGGKVPASAMYDLALGYMPFRDAMEIMSKAKFGYHVHHGYTVGRAICEFAALCVPCICSNTCEACRRLFPSLSTAPFDIKRQHDLIEKLIEDDDKYVESFMYAYKEVDYYSLENCYKRMCRAVEEVSEKNGERT